MTDNALPVMPVTYLVARSGVVSVTPFSPAIPVGPPQPENT